MRAKLQNRNWSEWIIRAGIRSIKTMAQTALGFITVGMAMSDIDWKYLVSVTLVAGIASLITSLAGIPELEEPNELD